MGEGEWGGGEDGEEYHHGVVMGVMMRPFVAFSFTWEGRVHGVTCFALHELALMGWMEKLALLLYLVGNTGEYFEMLSIVHRPNQSSAS